VKFVYLVFLPNFHFLITVFCQLWWRYSVQKGYL